MTINELARDHSVIALDANAIIYMLEAASLGKLVRALVELIEGGDLRGVVSAVGVAEILVKPAITGDVATFERYAEELRGISNLRIVSIDAETAVDAAWIRGQNRIGLTDSLHLACARAAGATAFVTNDPRIPSRPGLDVVLLSELQAV